MRRVCVFCGSNPGIRPEYADAARGLAAALVARGLELVYGGGNVGLMGIVADAVMTAGGTVTGIIPEALMRMEAGHRDVSRLHVVGSMHERKAMMAEMSDAFIALPGGIGTLEEVFEVWTWGQLGLHAKPAGFLDVGGFYRHLHAFLDHMTAEGFLKQRHRDMVTLSSDPMVLLDGFADYTPPQVVKVIAKETA
ncbi:TIGR00730 family Rossman fold protein [Magnetospirillum sulfuroxidans]|uniref:Cytokinin riboside 5'-monophosphate phosphoribohydrolase n=1 Tax=Magnetospirillum sulfuroxidans TaxID=611300 RepID=A0ABS5I7H2_9PROT|nr:TIGR00730 family Rossman fold protein [Magnetospirillum sulfuroxidans]MBR9970379.1 TIGR00730 family Rossman fold protein [Magnetospirillum sulfuroxidans]